MCQLLGDAVLVIPKFIVMSQKGSFWHGIKTDILHITYYIFHILIPKSGLVFFYNRPHFIWRQGLNHCGALVRSLPTSISVRTSVSLFTFHTPTILAPPWFTNFERCRFQNLPISMLSWWLVLHGMASGDGRSC